MAFGLVIVAMAYSIGWISGCHINPVVSLAMLVAKMANLHLLGDASNYVINNAIEGVTAGTIIGSLLVEIVLTFPFIYVILNLTDSKNEGVGKKADLIIGLALFLVHPVGIPFPQATVSYDHGNEDTKLSAKERKEVEAFVEEQRDLSKGIDDKK